MVLWMNHDIDVGNQIKPLFPFTMSVADQSG